MFSRIFAWIFSLVLLVFPSLDKYSPALNVNQSVKSVISAIKTRDIDAIEAFMCKNIKDNTEDLREEIGKLIDAIEGNITRTSSESSTDTRMSSGGKTIELAISVSNISTSSETYQLNIRWEVYNNYAFEERGIRYVELFAVTDNEYELLAEIRATGGSFG